MSISINSSQSTSVKASLNDSLMAANMAATKMATGDAIINAYEDPTALAIGLNMRSDLGVLRTVLKGIEQSQSMLYLAEAGAKAIYDTTSQMTEILSQAKLGYMSDELVQKTLSPTYAQLKQEINRIADSVNFNGQTLLNGQSGTKNAGIASKISSTPKVYSENGNATITLSALTTSDPNATPPVNTIKVIAATVTGGTAGEITFTTPTTGNTAPIVTGGTVITDDMGNVIVSGATLVFSNITATDTPGSGTAKTTVGNLVVDNVDLTFKVGEFTYLNGKITSNTGKAPVMSQLSLADLSFTPTSDSSDITEISGFSPSATAIGQLTFAGSSTTSQISISNLTATRSLSGGVEATSVFSFVTGSDLSNDIVQLAFPNMRLNKSYNGVLGMMDTLNTEDNISPVQPTDLTDLETISDANIDIPIIKALQDLIICFIDELGAYETRLINIEEQLQSNVAQLDNAQAVFLDADLADETENFVRANVQINIAISALKQMNSSLQALQQLIS